MSPAAAADNSSVETPMTPNEPIALPKVFQPYNEKYKFSPYRVSEHITYYNANSDEFYHTVKPEQPTCTLWILTQAEKVAYPNRRIVEEGFLQNIQVELKYIKNFNFSMSQKGLRSIYYNNKLVEDSDLPDVVLPRLGANVTPAGLSVIRQFEAMDVLLLNPISSIDVSMNKLYTMQVLAAHNLPIPKTMIAQPPFNQEIIKKEFQFPLVLKRASGSQGKGVMLIQNEEMLDDVGDMVDSSAPLIFQEFIEHSKGRDLRVWVMGGRCCGAMMRVATKGFKANIHQHGVGKNVKLSSAVEWLSIECCKLLGLDMGGVDFLVDKDTYKICEINASPGFEGLEKATGTNVPKQMLEFIKLRLGLWRKQTKKNKKFSVAVPVQEDHEEQK